MSVPTHGPFCQTLIYETSCWYCQEDIYVLQCTCGSAVLFDDIGRPWPKHACVGTGDAGGIGGSGLSGWEAVEVLRDNGMPISRDLWKQIFPGHQPSERQFARPTVDIKRIDPTARRTVDLLAVVREIHKRVARVSEIEHLPPMGKRLLGLDAGTKYWQVTLVRNDTRPNETYTALIPEHLARNLKREMIVGARLSGRVQGNFSIWLASDINPI